MQRWTGLVLVLGGVTLAALVACNGITIPSTTDTDPNSTGDTKADDSTLRKITGTILAPESAKLAPRATGTGNEPSYRVVAQSTATGDTYSTETDSNGNFYLLLDEEAAGTTFTVTLLGPDGRPKGPVIFGQDTAGGQVGLQVDGRKSLGTIQVPEDPNSAALTPGSGADYSDSDVSNAVHARLNDAGVPIGVPSFGRGDDAQGTPSGALAQQGDRDMDGLIDMFDADDDGDGLFDDEDDDATLVPGIPAGLQVNFFMNLKIDDTQATAYFSGDTAGIETSLKNDTVITFEVRADASLGKSITAARIIAPPAPAPAYLATCTTGNPPALWSTASFALRPDGTNHFQEWAVPHDFMSTGDTFTVEITYDDGTKGVYSRMINYVFKSIPKLVNVGPPGALTTFHGPAEIAFDGTKDLAFEWNPPVDDFGHLITGWPYHLEVFYYDASNNQINDIDPNTWIGTIPDWNPDNQFLEIAGSALTLSSTNTFTYTVPKEVFVDTVQTGTGPVDVHSYKIDIAAQRNGNNAALMLRLNKS
jgi:uncharacterized protein (DUF736 family)